MASADQRYWITFNGEIFNYLELRDELQALGHRFASDSDTEVLLAAYAQWGPACQTRFNGMWAFAIWDSRDRVLFLSRDRWGIKPLLYSFDNGTFAFASELKAFAALDGFDNRIDQEHMALVLRDLCADERGERTLLAGVRRLPGGHCLTVRADGSHNIERWWRTLDHRRAVARNFEDQAAEFRELLYDACGLRMRSDVPLATALSGGLDSSSIACIVNELGRAQRGRHLAPEWQRAFVACFTGTRLDERPYAEQVIAHTGMQPVFVEMNLEQHIDRVEQIMFDNEAITDVLHLGPWCVYGAMRQNGIVVSMDGHGADELLAGYYQSILAEITDAAQKLQPLRYLDMRRTMKGLIGGSAVLPVRLADGPVADQGVIAGLACAGCAALRRITTRCATAKRSPRSTGSSTTCSTAIRCRRSCETSTAPRWRTASRSGCRSWTGGWPRTDSRCPTRASSAAVSPSASCAKR